MKYRGQRGQLLVWAFALSVGTVWGNELQNAGFEQADGGRPAAWVPVGKGFFLDQQVRHGGQGAIRCEAATPDTSRGAKQVIVYEKPDRRPIVIGGWSKAEQVGPAGDYCVFLDVIYADGKPWWGLASPWARGTHDWQYAAEVFWPEKPVREIRAYVFLRRVTGRAWFDDVFIHRGGLHLTKFRAASDYPRSATGQRIRGRLTGAADWRCALLDRSGREIDALTGHGERIAWNWDAAGRTQPAQVRITARAPNVDPLALLVPAAATPVRAANPVAQGYRVWWRDSMRKVYPTEFPPAEQAGEAAVALARNESEGFQLAITTANRTRLEKVQVSAGEFRTPQGDLLPRGAIETSLVGYIFVDAPSAHPQSPHEPNWCPEVLLPARPFDVPGGRTQTVWVNVHAGENVRAGVYRGRLTVRPAGAAATELPVSVRVYGFALPRTPRMKTAFAIMDGYTRAAYGTITPELRRKCLDLMLSHRLNPDDISRTDPPAIDDLRYAREHGMNTFNVLNLVPKPKRPGLWVCYTEMKDYGPGFTEELAQRLDGYVAELRRQGLSRMAYFYGFDERREEYDELIKSICKFLKTRYPEVQTFTTAGYMYEKRRHTPADYQDYMDWYCPLTPRYDRELSARLRQQGKQVWWYVCCGPHWPYANFASLDYPSIEGRLLGWMTYGWEADGLLYWHVNLWHPNGIIRGADPYLEWNPVYIAGMTGDGCLMYPTPSGPVSSIRLENIRDGIEDYDYLALLAEKRGRAAAAGYVERLVKSRKEYSRDAAELAGVRREMAEQLER
jgi:hypothetical protein